MGLLEPWDVVNSVWMTFFLEHEDFCSQRVSKESGSNEASYLSHMS